MNVSFIVPCLRRNKASYEWIYPVDVFPFASFLNKIAENKFSPRGAFGQYYTRARIQYDLHVSLLKRQVNYIALNGVLLLIL